MKLKKGFTLLEILLVITLIGILSGIILSAINPSRQLAQARDAERLSEIQKISNALDTYAANNRGEYPEGINPWYQDICPAGGGVDCVDLSVLVPTYLDSIPVDPDGVTNYRIGLDVNTGQISLQASVSEQEDLIAINPLPLFAKSVGGTGSDSVSSVSTLSDGSSIVVGSFQDTVILGQGETNQVSLVSAGGSDIFVIKYNANGNLIWAKQAGGSGSDSVLSVSTFSDGSSIATGSFSGTSIFGQGEVNQTSLVSTGDGDIYIAKYNADGTLIWAKRAGGADMDYGIDIIAKTDGSSVITGYFQNTVTFGQGEINETNFLGGIGNMFVARYNTDGSLAWAKQAIGNANAESLDGVENTVIVVGSLFGTVTFGQGEVNQTTLVESGWGGDIYIAKYNADGSLAWAKQAGGTDYEDVTGGVSVLTDGSSIITGSFSGSPVFGQGEVNQTTLVSTGFGNIYITKYNANGDLVWAKNAIPSLSGKYVDGVSTLTDGSSIIVGNFFGVIVLGSGESNETTLVSEGNSDVFIAKYNMNGNLIWAKRAGGVNTEVTSSIDTWSNGSSTITGAFQGSAIFGQEELNQTTLLSAGNYDGFIARYNADGELE